MARGAWLLLTLACTGCSLAIDVGDLQPGADPPPPVDASAEDSGDATSDEVRDGPSEDGAEAAEDVTPLVDAPCPSDGCIPLPPGTIRYALSDSATCPSGFVGTTVVESASAGNCTCKCAVTAPPSCPPTSLPSWFGATCATSGAALEPVACKNIPGSTMGAARINPTAGTGGACGPSVVGIAALPPRRTTLCTPATCAAAVCGSGAYRECIAAPPGGCPPTHPTPQTIGEGASIECPPCVCGVAATCGGTVDLFVAPSCSGTAAATIDNTCKPIASISFNSYSYKPNDPVVTCTPSYATAPGAGRIDKPRPLCCR